MVSFPLDKVSLPIQHLLTAQAPSPSLLSHSRIIHLHSLPQCILFSVGFADVLQYIFTLKKSLLKIYCLFVTGWRDVTPDAQVSEKGRQLILAQLSMVGDCVSVKSSVLYWVTWRRMNGMWSPGKALDHFSRSS